VIGDIRFELAEQLVRRIRKKGGAAIALEYDQRDEASIKSLVERAIAACGSITGYFGNAADIDPTKPPYSIDSGVASMDVAAWLDTYRVNTIGHAIAARELIPHMMANGGGALVFTSSDAAFTPFKRWIAYSSSKAGLATIARHICLTHGKQGVRANVVSPGLIASKAFQDLVENERSKGITDGTAGIVETINCPRLGEPRDVAGAVAFLLSGDGEYINGQALSVNGGSYCRP